MQRALWTERKFTFDFPLGWLPDIIERLRGTEVRLKEMTKDLTHDQMIFKPEGKWSVNEHIGHLADLESLHYGRLHDFKSGLNTLRAADMSNAKTNEANHNQYQHEKLIEDFSSERKKLITALENLDDKTQEMKAMHPRLQTIMRPVDVAFFAAEHDDHHLASIREIMSKI